MGIVIQISDTHLLEEPKKTYKDRSPYTQLLSAFEHIQKNINDLKLIIFSGDLVSDATPKAYQLLSKILNQIEMPIYLIPGNHDNKNLMNQYVQGKNIHQLGEVHLNNWLIVLLDSSTPGAKLGSGRLSISELQRLEKILEDHPQKDILIFIHHPPIVFGAKWFQEICLENRDDFNAIVSEKKNIRAIIFGHAHTQLNTYIKNCLYICSPSTWCQMDHSVGEMAVYNLEIPGGYNYYSLGEDGYLQFGTHYFNHHV